MILGVAVVHPRVCVYIKVVMWACRYRDALAIAAIEIVDTTAAAAYLVGGARSFLYSQT